MPASEAGCCAPVPSVFPPTAGPGGKTEDIFFKQRIGGALSGHVGSGRWMSSAGEALFTSGETKRNRAVNRSIHPSTKAGQVQPPPVELRQKPASGQ